jgi:hypothetical protein
VQSKSKSDMTDAQFISRNNFIENYFDVFDKLFKFTDSGDCILRDAHVWDTLLIQDMNSTGWTNDTVLFQRTLDFLKPYRQCADIFFTEIESLDKFSETYIVKSNRKAIGKLWCYSHLPHFNFVGFDKSENWCMSFDNDNNKLSIYRKKIGKFPQETILSF